MELFSCRFEKDRYDRAHAYYDIAPVVELVDAPDSKSGSFGSAGSSPAGGTIMVFKNGCYIYLLGTLFFR